VPQFLPPRLTAVGVRSLRFLSFLPVESLSHCRPASLPAPAPISSAVPSITDCQGEALRDAGRTRTSPSEAAEDYQAPVLLPPTHCNHRCISGDGDGGGEVPRAQNCLLSPGPHSPLLKDIVDERLFPLKLFLRMLPHC
jgi:hypothetical protein